MPGESVGHVYAGAMAPETIHFVEAVALDRPVLVTAEQARQVMELYIAADLSAELNEPVTLPLANKRPRLVADRRVFLLSTDVVGDVLTDHVHRDR